MQWQKTTYPGLRFREHPTRLHNGEKDRYFSVRCKINGKDVERGLGWTSGGITVEFALQTLEELRGSFRTPQKRPLPRVRNSSLPFSRFWQEHYLPHITRHKAASSVGAESGIFANWLEPAFGNLPFNQITTERLEYLMHEMIESGRKIRTARYALTVVSCMWELGLQKNFDLPPNPCHDAVINTPDRAAARLLKPAEMRKIVATLARRDREIYDAVVLALFCGLSPGEMFRLTWADVNLSGGTIFVPDGKKRRSRSVYIPAAINELLRKRNWEGFSRMGGMQITDYVFPRKQNIQREWFNRTFERIAVEEGWNRAGAQSSERITMASFRHIFAIWLITGGVALNTVADLMGHKTITLVQRFARLAPSPERLCRSILDQHWGEVDSGK